MTDFERSVELAVRRSVSKDTTKTDYAFEMLRAGTTILCQRMQHAVPALDPCEVLAILGFKLEFEELAQGYHMVTRVLLRNGWSVQQTAQFYENFRNANPELFDVRLSRLLTRGQLHATYGATYGDALADVLVDPRYNPLLYAMLYGNIMEPVEMVFRTAAVPVVFGKNMLFAPSAEGFNTVAIPTIPFGNLEGHYLDYPTAQRLYKAMTGGSLAPSLTLSLNDHGLDQTPKTKKALRQANRA